MNLNKLMDDLEEQEKTERIDSDHPFIIYKLKNADYINQFYKITDLNAFAIISYAEKKPIIIKKIEEIDRKYYIYFQFTTIEIGDVMKNIKLNYDYIHDIKNNIDIDPLLITNKKDILKYKSEIITISVENKYKEQSDKKITNITLLPKFITENKDYEKFNDYHNIKTYMNGDKNKIEISNENLLFNIIKNNDEFKEKYSLYINYESILFIGLVSILDWNKITYITDDLKFKNKNKKIYLLK